MLPSHLRSRGLVLDLLDAVLRRHRPLDEVLAGHAELARLEPRDRAHARLLIGVLLRRLGQIDSLLARYLDRPLRASAGGAQDLLRLGVAQLAFLQTPAHAAVSTTVELARQRRLSGFAGLVNAVLRRVAADLPGSVEKQDPVLLNCPPWLWGRLVAAFGPATARAVVLAQLADPPLDLSVKADAAGWAERLGGRVLPTGSLRLPPGGGSPTELPGFAEGAWWVQDAAAALPARLLPVQPGATVVDLCAAPGGKTALLAARGARMTAVDVSGPRVARIRENLGRLGLEAVCEVADARQWRPPEPADAVLLDAPCSATGTLRRHPDVAHLKQPGDLVPLAALQDGLLDAAAEMVKPGGTLLYATCSLLPVEGEERATAFLERHPGYSVDPFSPAEVPGLEEAVGDRGDLRLLPSFWPDEGGIDGFYLCRFKRAG